MAWPVWRVVLDAGLPLSEVLGWDLEDLRTAHAVLDMRRDYKDAADAYEAEQMKKNTERKE